MEENLSGTNIHEAEVKDNVAGSKASSIPYLKSWHRSGDCIGMELSCTMVQVNFLADHIKILLWARPDQPDLMVTSICTAESRTSVETASLSSQGTLTAKTRSLLGRVEAKVKNLFQ